MKPKNHAAGIKSMKLYSHPERVVNELVEIGKEGDQPLEVEDLTGFDQLHYHGTAAVDEAIEKLGIDSDSRVLEIGSGLGGPARYLAQRTGARVTALELQPDQHQLALDLTRRCQLERNVEHLCGDFLTFPWDDSRFDIIVSWLAIYHIPEREHFLEITDQILEPGGLYHAEDLFAGKSLSMDERMSLDSQMYAGYLPDIAGYQEDFENAGFEILECTDMSDNWSGFITDRLKDYQQAAERHIRVHGEATYQALEQFYALVNDHFRSGRLGGVKFIARKP